MRLVVRNAESLDLILCEILRVRCGYFLISQGLCGKQTRVTGDHHIIIIDHDWVQDAEGLNRLSDCLDRLFVVVPRVVRVRNELGDFPVGDLQHQNNIS